MLDVVGFRYVAGHNRTLFDYRTVIFASLDLLAGRRTGHGSRHNTLSNSKGICYGSVLYLHMAYTTRRSYGLTLLLAYVIGLDIPLRPSERILCGLLVRGCIT